MAQTAPQILAVLNLSENATVQETIVDAAINKLNRYGAPTITNMAGTAGSKTVTLTSKQQDAVLDVARIIYANYYKNAEGTLNTTVGNLGISSQDMMSNATVLNAIKDIARCLRDDGELPYLIFNEVPLVTEDEA
jgi:hypothetical protein